MDLKLTYAGEVEEWSINREFWHVNEDSILGMLAIKGSLELRTLASSLDMRLELAQAGGGEDFFSLMNRLAQDPQSIRMEITVIITESAKDLDLDNHQ